MTKKEVRGQNLGEVPAWNPWPWCCQALRVARREQLRQFTMMETTVERLHQQSLCGGSTKDG